MLKGRRYKKASSRIAKREKIRKSVTLFIKIGVPVVFLVGLISISRAEFLQIKDFEVTGGEVVSKENIKGVAESLSSGTSLFFIPKTNIFILDEEKLANVLLSNFGRLESVDINKNFFSKNIKISVEERQSDFLWCSESDECFFMDKSGLVFESLPGGVLARSEVSDGKPRVVFKGNLKEDPLMKNFATTEKMQNYINFIGVLNNVGFEVSSINVESDNKAIARTKIGDIVFSPEEKDLFSVAQNVALLVNEIKSKDPSVNFEYIDARFGNKVFYKLY